MYKRIDNTQHRIVKALRQAGCSVCSLAPLGGGVPDLLVSHHGILYLMECKSEHGKLTAREQEWMDSWDGSVYIVHDELEALSVLGVILY
jgi:Holliday junction resolvase